MFSLLAAHCVPPCAIVIKSSGLSFLERSTVRMMLEKSWRRKGEGVIWERERGRRKSINESFMLLMFMFRQPLTAVQTSTWLTQLVPLAQCLTIKSLFNYDISLPFWVLLLNVLMKPHYFKQKRKSNPPRPIDVCLFHRVTVLPSNALWSVFSPND